MTQILAYLTLERPQEIAGTIIAFENSIQKVVWLPGAHKLAGFPFKNPKIDGNVNFLEATGINSLE